MPALGGVLVAIVAIRIVWNLMAGFLTGF